MRNVFASSSVSPEQKKKCLTVWDFVAAAKRTQGSLFEKAAQALDLLAISDEYAYGKFNDKQIEWALVGAYHAENPGSSVVSLWKNDTKKFCVCIVCGHRFPKYSRVSWDDTNTTPEIPRKSGTEDKAEHIQAFKEYYKARKPTPVHDKTIEEVEKTRGHGKARPLGFPPIQDKPEDYCPASIAEFIKAVKLFPVDPPKEKQYLHRLTLEERAYKALRYLFPHQDPRAYTPAQVERALVGVFRADHPESGAVSLWRYTRRNGTKVVRSCILCGRSSQEYATPTFCAKHPDHPNSTQAEREDKAKHLQDFADFVTWKAFATPPKNKTDAKIKAKQ